MLHLKPEPTLTSIDASNHGVQADLRSINHMQQAINLKLTLFTLRKGCHIKLKIRQ